MPKQKKSSPNPETRTIEDVIEFGYRTFSEYVTRERLVPSLEDGLKPVYKRVLVSAHRICSRKFIKTATLSGYSLGNYHPHSVDSIDDVITELVHMGLLEGDGAFGSKSLTGNHSPASASRYTMVRLNQDYADVLDMLLRFVPLVEGEMDNMEPAYLPAPVPLLCGYGSFSLAPGLMVRLPAFTWQSMMEAYRKDDPSLLRSAYGYRILNPDSLSQIWTSGRADMILSLDLQAGTLSGTRGVFVSGSPDLFVPDLSVLDPLRESGEVSVTDVSSGSDNRLFIGLSRKASASPGDLVKMLEPAVTHKETVLMMALTGGTARPCGLKAWIRSSLKAFTDLVDKYKEDRISRCRRKIEMFQAFDGVRKYILRNAGKPTEPSEIAKAAGTTEEIVKEIDAMSVRAMRSADPDAEIRSLEAEIRKTSRIRGKAVAGSLIKALGEKT